MSNTNDLIMLDRYLQLLYPAILKSRHQDWAFEEGSLASGEKSDQEHGASSKRILSTSQRLAELFRAPTVDRDSWFFQIWL
jgi:hypothetical protein